MFGITITDKDDDNVVVMGPALVLALAEEIRAIEAEAGRDSQ